MECRWGLVRAGGFDFVSHDEAERKAVHVNADKFAVQNSCRDGVEHRGHIRVGNLDIATDHRLCHRRSAGEVNRPDIEPSYLPQTCFEYHLMQAPRDAEPAVADPDSN